MNGIRRRLGISWDTAWASTRSILEKAAADESRFENVTILGVDEHSGITSPPSPSRSAGAARGS